MLPLEHHRHISTTETVAMHEHSCICRLKYFRKRVDVLDAFSLKMTAALAAQDNAPKILKLQSKTIPESRLVASYAYIFIADPNCM